MAMGRGGAGGWDLRPRPTWLLPFPIPAPPWDAGHTTLPHPRPLGPREDLPYPTTFAYIIVICLKNMKQCAKKIKNKKLKQLEHDKKHTYCLLEALSDQPFFFPFNRAPLIATNKNTNFK